MIRTDQVEIDVKKSIDNSLDEIEKIKNDKLPKHSYKHMLNRVREQLNEEEQYLPSTRCSGIWGGLNEIGEKVPRGNP